MDNPKNDTIVFSFRYLSRIEEMQLFRFKFLKKDMTKPSVTQAPETGEQRTPEEKTPRLTVTIKTSRLAIEECDLLR